MPATLTRHAHERVVEFGLGIDVVTDIATHPDVAHTNGRGESVRWSDRHPDWSIVVGDDGVVITVLRRTPDRWEHDPAPARRDPLTPSAAASFVAEGPTRSVVDPPRRPSGRRRPAVPARRGAVASLAVDPGALRLARDLAGGDVRRLRFNPDGSITILNRPNGRTAR